ncbi:hypothetical protein E2C01_036269 [Portunus trituberculatus]|uniref:Uncharacterized protein n=1 Tax=Portunus trituberculatus TaxID=210409 RepID=A0A5B7F6C3_PORTR|nr:hypothetical protein [Portunus trituberculatus]
MMLTVRDSDVSHDDDDEGRQEEVFCSWSVECHEKHVLEQRVDDTPPTHKHTHLVKNRCASCTVPKKATRPSASRRRRSNMANTSELGWWMVAMTVLPSSVIFFMAFTTLWAMKESRPEVGSSHSSSSGLVIICDMLGLLSRSYQDKDNSHVVSKGSIVEHLVAEPLLH